MSTTEQFNPWRDAPSIPSTSPWDKPMGRQTLRTAQVIVGALVAAGAVFMATVVVLGPQMALAGGDGKVFTYTAIGAAMMMLAGRAFIPAMVDKQAIRAMHAGNWQAPRPPGDKGQIDEFLHETGDAGRLCLLFVQHTIISSSLIEGPAIFLLVAYLCEAAPVALATAAIMLSLLAAHFPTRTNAERWVEKQLDTLDAPPAWGA
jgi:hypothetical protein